jgi:hypothetical protein
LVGKPEKALSLLLRVHVETCSVDGLADDCGRTWSHTTVSRRRDSILGLKM